jgi:hypothetical protein
MDERLRRQGVRQRRRGSLARISRALASDVALAARTLGTLAGLTAAGLVAGLAVAGLTREFSYMLAGILLGALVGGALGLLAVMERRLRNAVRRAHSRALFAFALVSSITAVVIVLLAPFSFVLAVILGLVAAVAVAAAGALALVNAERAVVRAAAARRTAWLAQVRAARLTRRILGLDAYRRLRRDGALPEPSRLYPGRTYLVPLRTTPAGARILVLEHGRAIGGLCLRPREPLPDPEEALTHIFAIRTDERAWLARANFFPQDRYLSPQARGLLPGRPGNYDR